MRRTAVVAGAVLAVGVLAACTSGGSGSGSGGSTAGGAVADSGGGKVAPAPAAGAPSASRGSASGGGGTDGSSGDITPVGDVTVKIRTAQLSVSVGRGKVDDAAARAYVVTARFGGEVDGDDRSSGPDATAALQIRVPPDALARAVDALAALGHEDSRAMSSTDVTEKVADVASRVASARDSITRLRTLYASAGRVADIIAIESELSSREADLESLEAQQRSLDRQTSMATITLSLTTSAPAGTAPAKKHRHGFLGGLQRGWDGFVSGASWVAVAIGTALPFLVVVALLALAGRVVWRRRPRRPVPVPSE
jgi:Domain of unknown function (DUF4349)